MPFQSEAQRRYLWAKHPKIAQKWANEEKNAELKVQRGLLANTVKVDGQDYKVNEGYLKPALTGAGAAALVHGLVGLFNHGANRKVFMDSFKSGIPGAIAGIALTEAKRRSIEGILNSDPEAAKALAKKGLNIKARSNIAAASKFSGDAMPHASNMFRDLYHQAGIDSLASEGIKVGTINESKMISDLDDVEDKAHHMHLVYEGSALAAMLADTSKPQKAIELLGAAKNAKSEIVLAPASYKEGSKYFSFDNFSKAFPESVSKLTPSELSNAKNHGVILMSASDINKASLLREMARSGQSKKLSAIENLPNNRAFKALSKANIIYSLAARSDDRVADASAGAQFAMYVPRALSDIKATIGANKLSKGTLLKNVAFTGTRLIPGLLPAAGRAFRKYQDKPIAKKETI